jgi:hypothetical protein
MVSYLSVSEASLHPTTAVLPAAREMRPAQRQHLALQALAGTSSLRRLAAEREVSRKFVSRQRDRANDALHEEFFPEETGDQQVLFYLPVTKAWMEQAILGLTLICHSSLRGAGEFFRDLLDYPLSAAKVREVLQRAVTRAHPYNRQQPLEAVRLGAHDEIFQGRRPVLVGADVDSTYCYLLSLEDQRDGDTWALRLMELQDRGFHPEATIADAGSGLRAGQTLAMPDVPCRGDVFHALQTVQPLATFLENRAYDAMADLADLQRKKARRKWRGQRTADLERRLGLARRAESNALALAEDVATLVGWLRQDILSLAGPNHVTRCELYDFVVDELRARESRCPHRIGPVVRALEKQRDQLLAFAARIDRDLINLSLPLRLPAAALREVFNLEAMAADAPARPLREAALRTRLGERFAAVRAAVAEVVGRTTRASSVIENLNSRLRGYFFLRRHLGSDYLALLQFFLNHRRFLRSERPERVGKSPAELLTREKHPHWLEMLGYTRFSRS